MSDPKRSFLLSHWWQIMLALLAIGAASQELSGKADYIEVERLDHRLADVERSVRRSETVDSLLREIRSAQQEQSQEFRTVRTLVCRLVAGDSWCG